MNQIIKINEKEHHIEYNYDLIDYWIRNEDLIKVRKGEFFWTKKHFVRWILSLSKIVPFPDKLNLYLFVFRIQFTNLYSDWMRSKYSISL